MKKKCQSQIEPVLSRFLGLSVLIGSVAIFTKIQVDSCQAVYSKTNVKV